MRISYIAIVSFFAAIMSAMAEPIEYQYEDVTLRVSGYGTAGMIEPDFALNNAKFLGDWSVRGQMTYDADNTHRLGFVYSLDEQTVDGGGYIDDLFALWQVKGLGRVEVGLTDSVAKKLGLGLPDVGGLRINDNPLLYKEIKPHGAVIADTILDTNDDDVRINVVSAQNNGMQYGLSLAGGGKDNDFTLDGGIKIRRPNGKTKTAYSLSASFMSRPDDFKQSQFSPRVTADWRAQVAAAVNVQYNSWMFAITSRAIYDKNPVGVVSDGFILGAGASYDLLKYTVSLSYTFSDTGVWDSDVDDFIDQMIVSSLRYKYSEYVDGWMSIGVSSKTPFVSAGMRIAF